MPDTHFACGGRDLQTLFYTHFAGRAHNVGAARAGGYARPAESLPAAIHSLEARGTAARVLGPLHTHKPSPCDVMSDGMGAAVRR